MRRSAPAGVAAATTSTISAAAPRERTPVTARIETRHYSAPRRAALNYGVNLDRGQTRGRRDDGVADRRHADGRTGRPAFEAERALDCHHQIEIQRVPCVARDHVAQDRTAQQGEVADEV